MILKQDGSLWSTPIAFHGNIEEQRVTGKQFVQVIPHGVMSMAAGTGYSMVVKHDGSVWASGRNYLGQLGDGSKVRKTSFVFVRTIPGAQAVATGGGHSLVLADKGVIWGTGWNKYGQLGEDGPSTCAKRFFVSFPADAKAMDAGRYRNFLYSLFVCLLVKQNE